MSGESPGSVLVVDDDPSVCAVVERWLGSEGYDVEVVHSGENCLAALAHMLPDTICLDLNMPGMDGLETLQRIKTTHRLLPVIILTATTEVDTVVATMQLGAYDYLAKPLDRNKLVTTVRNAVRAYNMSVRLLELERSADGVSYEGIVGRTPPMQALFRQMDRVASTDISVLIYGESGTGKELVARAIHQNSGRKDGGFVALNCAAIPETLQESELFGHERGAFTGASGTRIGKFEQADGGTLFLDEVGELAMSLQAKLLRVLQERRFQRVGGSKEIRADFRLLSATHRNLWDMVQEGRFREDLYFRIVVFELEIAPLRNRVDDVPLLTQKFLNDYREHTGGSAPRISSEATGCLMSYHWPGNVRELQNAIQRAMVVATEDVITPDDLPPSIQRAVGRDTFALAVTSRKSSRGPAPPEVPLENDSQQPHTLAELERLAIQRALQRTRGNLSQACRELGIGRTTLYRKLKTYNLR